jgi:hypothetical protein
MKITLKNIYFALFCVVALVSPVFAASENTESGNSLLLLLFLGFFALIVIFQLVPACLMFVGIVKGLVSQKDVQESRSVINK